MSPFQEGCIELGCLECEDAYLLSVDLALLGELPGLDLEHRGLVADFFRLLAERQDRECGRDDREHGEDRGGYGGELGREGERHGRRLARARPSGGSIGILGGSLSCHYP